MTVGDQTAGVNRRAQVCFFILCYMPRLLAESACKDDEFAVKDTNSLQDNDARHRAAAKATDSTSVRRRSSSFNCYLCLISVFSTPFSTNINPPLAKAAVDEASGPWKCARACAQADELRLIAR